MQLFGKKAVSWETKLNRIEQHGKKINLVLFSIPDTLEDKDLESTVSSMFSDTDVIVGPQDIEACHRISLSG